LRKTSRKTGCCRVQSCRARKERATTIDPRSVERTQPKAISNARAYAALESVRRQSLECIPLTAILTGTASWCRWFTVIHQWKYPPAALPKGENGQASLMAVFERLKRCREPRNRSDSEHFAKAISGVSGLAAMPFVSRPPWRIYPARRQEIFRILDARGLKVPTGMYTLSYSTLRSGASVPKLGPAAARKGRLLFYNLVVGQERHSFACLLGERPA
jgi:hypothetical protein